MRHYHAFLAALCLKKTGNGPFRLTALLFCVFCLVSLAFHAPPGICSTIVGNPTGLWTTVRLAEPVDATLPGAPMTLTGLRLRGAGGEERWLAEVRPVDLRQGLSFYLPPGNWVEVVVVGQELSLVGPTTRAIGEVELRAPLSSEPCATTVLGRGGWSWSIPTSPSVFAGVVEAGAGVMFGC
jgi:hypothetical protein